MADESEVSQALVDTIAGAIYPGGPSGPSAAVQPCRVYRGWPEAKGLDLDVAGGIANITVFPDAGMTRNVSRYWPETIQTATIIPTITASVTGATVTFGGTVTAGNVVGVQFGADIFAAAYAYRALLGDTLTTVAAALAALVPGASSAGPTLTMPNNIEVGVGIMTPQPVSTEIRRQDECFRVTIWTNSPTARDALAGMIDGIISGLRDANGAFTRFMQIKPGELGWIRYLRSYTIDTPSRNAVWRRDLLYQVEYPTSLVEFEPVMLFGAGTLATG